jgi:hypothetical protein
MTTEALLNNGWSSNTGDGLYGRLIDASYVVHRGRNVSE